MGDILEPRVEEIFELVRREIERVKLTELLASGVVLTGGTTLLPGMVEMAEEIIGLPVRRGIPQGVGGLVDIISSPKYATGVGLVQYGAQHMDHRHFHVRDENVFGKVKSRMKAWLSEMI